MKAGAIALGKKVLLSSKAFVAGGIAATVETGSEARTLPTGLYPRKAANKAEVAEMWLNAGMSCAAPALVSADEMAPGKLLESAPSTIEKKSARLIVCPTF